MDFQKLNTTEQSKPRAKYSRGVSAVEKNANFIVSSR